MTDPLLDTDQAPAVPGSRERHDGSPTVPAGQLWKVACARSRPVVLVAAVIILFGFDLAEGLGVSAPDLPAAFNWVALGTFLLVSFLPWLAIDAPSTGLAAPVRGRWLAINSPASRVPSHGTLGYGQSHAIDLVMDPDDGSRPQFGQGHGFLPPEAFPAFGAPIHSPVDGVVVAARNHHRDHRSRNRGWSLLYLLVEGTLRELGGAGFVVGNHLVIQRDGGGHVVLAHLQRDSLQVEAGDRVHTGQVVAACGNSGNSSEPHLHLQLMDHAHASLAAGLPFHWDPEASADPGTDALPPTGSHLVA